jgi:RNA polymerase sigma-70 factor (ECF subfamily)
MRRGYRYALALTHDSGRAADLLQEACLAVVRAGGTWSRGYLFSAVRTRHLNQIRRARLVVIEPMEDPDLFEGDAGDLLTEAEAMEFEDPRLEAALGTLGEDQREALFLAAVEGYTAAEIGELMDRPRNTVLSLIFRARKKLRAQLENREEASA